MAGAQLEAIAARDGELSRGNMIGRALWLCDWIGRRRAPFTALQLAAEMEASKRTALRWLEVAEGLGLVECDRSRPLWRWVPVHHVQ